MGAEMSQPEAEASHSSQQQRQPQPQPPESQTREGSRREAWLLPPQREAATPCMNRNSSKAVENSRSVTAKHSASGTQSAKPLKEVNFPHNFQDILKDADSPVDKSSMEKLHDQLYAGVFLDHKTKRYWLDKWSNGNCFLLYARALSITWAENQNYWKWVSQEEPSGTLVDVVELKRVCWLEVHGKFNTRKLSPGILYEVSFVVMLKEPAQGWEVPVNVRLVLPGGNKQERKENLVDKVRVRWIEIPVGQFVASAQDAGEMEFSLYEYEGGIWKQGLVIKGIAIKPKN